MVVKELHPKDLHMMPSGNRTIKNSVVEKIKKSIQQYGILRAVVVIKTDLFAEGNKYYIADGQHLYLSCISLNMLSQLPIIVVKNKFEHIHEIVKFISVLNTSQSPWRLADYVAAYAATNSYLSYNKLISKKKQYDLPYSLLAVIYGGIGRKQASEDIRSGQFRVKNEPKGDLISQYILDMIPLFGRTNSTSLLSLAQIFTDWFDQSEYSHVRFKKYVTMNLAKFNLATTTEMRRLIEDYDKTVVNV